APSAVVPGNSGAPKTSTAPAGGSNANGANAKTGAAAGPRASTPASGAAVPATGTGAAGSTAAPAPAGGNGGATDSGVSATEIRSGMIAMEGMVAGNYLALPTIRSVQGAAAAINDRGGIYGRRIKVFN